MSFLWRHFRREVDYSSLEDGTPDDDADAPLPAPSRAKRVLACAGVIMFGAIFLVAAVAVGIRVDWVLTDTIPWRNTEIWGWPPMVFCAVVGLAVTCFGVHLLARAVRAPRL
ncbi:hypothetical protein ACIQTT_08155 [Microbacterium sp. NPDC090225]|uniref:hypothetical protein n=1 Tax=Microbacterium sp. NPDC090225 TaxID=3364207 RepID=UPI00382B41C5